MPLPRPSDVKSFAQLVAMGEETRASFAAAHPAAYAHLRNENVVINRSATQVPLGSRPPWAEKE